MEFSEEVEKVPEILGVRRPPSLPPSLPLSGGRAAPRARSSKGRSLNWVDSTHVAAVVTEKVPPPPPPHCSLGVFCVHALRCMQSGFGGGVALGRLAPSTPPARPT